MMKACEKCKGDGIVWVGNRLLDPRTNIYRRRFRCEDGAVLTFYDYSMLQGLRVYEWEFQCYACGGRGIIEWTRGKSLTPLRSLTPRTE